MKVTSGATSTVHLRRVPVGTTFQKSFHGCGTFVGTVTSHDDVEDLYLATYEDGDTEEFAWVELAKLLKKSGDTVTAPLAVPPLATEVATVLPSEIPNGTTIRTDGVGAGEETGTVVAYDPKTALIEISWSGGTRDHVKPDRVKQMMLATALRDFARTEKPPPNIQAVVQSLASTTGSVVFDAGEGVNTVHDCTGSAPVSPSLTLVYSPATTEVDSPAQRMIWGGITLRHQHPVPNLWCSSRRPR